MDVQQCSVLTYLFFTALYRARVKLEQNIETARKRAVTNSSLLRRLRFISSCGCGWVWVACSMSCATPFLSPSLWLSLSFCPFLFASQLTAATESTEKPYPGGNHQASVQPPSAPSTPGHPSRAPASHCAKRKKKKKTLCGSHNVLIQMIIIILYYITYYKQVRRAQNICKDPLK